MHFKISCIIFFVSGFLSIEAAAITPQWTVQPNVCIAKSVGDSCQITITITAHNIPSGEHCLYLDNQQISCISASVFKQKAQISLVHNTRLELKNQKQETILSKQLSIKYQDAPPLRRRIRNPWSLF
ncbi:DUF3019 domain-containing protein [Paraglaciecola sp. L3A3]|uniref:DUF3019 domain-containing protein n=1 Tax=Paraglaciecola sp. L3A3 TaxID=2686358 RepID=UPI00131AB416|nr:DUF3019 domain-containing protein [Paraglaciecola sp. L3A3]